MAFIDTIGLHGHHHFALLCVNTMHFHAIASRKLGGNGIARLGSAFNNQT